jgi:hypothetical protein
MLHEICHGNEFKRIVGVESENIEVTYGAGDDFLTVELLALLEIGFSLASNATNPHTSVLNLFAWGRGWKFQVAVMEIFESTREFESEVGERS